jgi:hypothetical protein
MTLTREQIAAAEARGCALFPATPDQVARLGMQRRLVVLDGRPHVATRGGGGFLETHGTLAALVDRTSGSEPGTAESVEEALAADAETAATAAERGGGGEAGAGVQVLRRRAALRRRGRGRLGRAAGAASVSGRARGLRSARRGPPRRRALMGRPRPRPPSAAPR